MNKVRVPRTKPQLFSCSTFVYHPDKGATNPRTKPLTHSFTKSSASGPVPGVLQGPAVWTTARFLEIAAGEREIIPSLTDFDSEAEDQIKPAPVAPHR